MCAHTVAQPVDEQRNHAFRAAGSGILGRHAQAPHRAQKIVGIDIGADLASGDRSLKKRAKGGSESLVEVPRQAVERGISRMQSLGEPPFCCNEGCIALHPSRQRLAWLVLRSQSRRGVRAGVNFATEDRRDEVGALRKVTVNGPDADARLLSDLTDRNVHSRGGEYRQGCLEQQINVALGVGAHAPIRAAARLQTIILFVRLVAHHIPLDKRNIVPYKTDACSVCNIYRG
jgi:hypothetical protein